LLYNDIVVGSDTTQSSACIKKKRVRDRKRLYHLEKALYRLMSRRRVYSPNVSSGIPYLVTKILVEQDAFIGIEIIGIQNALVNLGMIRNGL
jgi:hypothetical protein